MKVIFTNLLPNIKIISLQTLKEINEKDNFYQSFANWTMYNGLIL